MSDSRFRRDLVSTLRARLEESADRIQVVRGPRQVGKTTAVRQLLAEIDAPSHYASADDPTLRDAAWLEAQWEEGRRLARARNGAAVLAVDEIQKVSGWAETVKRLWDEDRGSELPLRVVLLGSATLLVQHGLSESLAGRFELISAPHWSFGEMRDAFGFSLDEFIFFGGYPGAARLIEDEARWAAYVLDSIVETTISRDLLLLTRVDKPALLRSLFRLVCDYSSQIVSYQKLTGQIQDAGNTTTLAHYLDLLAAAGLAVGLEKYSGRKVRQRRSTPKLLALNTALVSAMSGRTFAESRADPGHWGRLVETAVGAHLPPAATPALRSSTGAIATGRSTSSSPAVSSSPRSRSRAAAAATASPAWPPSRPPTAPPASCSSAATARRWRRCWLKARRRSDRRGGKTAPHSAIGRRRDMAYEMNIRGTQSEVKIRNPWAVALLPIVTLGIYHLVWWYKINKELKELGEAKGYDLGQNPTNSVLALFPGGLIIVPALISYWHGTKRVMGASKIAGQEPVSGWISIILYLLLAPAFWAYLQVSLNNVWEQEAEAMPGTAPPPPPSDQMPPRLDDQQ